MSPKQVPPNNDPLARMTAMQEANARQKASIDRLMAERTKLLDMLLSIYYQDLDPEDSSIRTLLKGEGYDV